MRTSVTETLEVNGEALDMSVIELAEETGMTEDAVRSFFRGEMAEDGVAEEVIRRAVFGSKPAVRAADCLNEMKNGSRFEPNHSTVPEEQYVDVYEDPHEMAGMSFSLNRAQLQSLRVEADVVFDGMFINMEDGEADHRLWFADATPNRFER